MVDQNLNKVNQEKSSTESDAAYRYSQLHSCLAHRVQRLVKYGRAVKAKSEVDNTDATPDHVGFQFADLVQLSIVLELVLVELATHPGTLASQRQLGRCLFITLPVN